MGLLQTYKIHLGTVLNLQNHAKGLFSNTKLRHNYILQQIIENH